VLRQPGGHLLLIGLDGTGKNTIMELASFISNCQMLKLNVKKGYSYNDFRDDLKNLFKMTGIRSKQIVFFIADKDIYEVCIYRNLKNKLIIFHFINFFLKGTVFGRS
jgi:dynein heavy chain